MNTDFTDFCLVFYHNLCLSAKICVLFSGFQNVTLVTVLSIRAKKIKHKDLKEDTKNAKNLCGLCENLCELCVKISYSMCRNLALTY